MRKQVNVSDRAYDKLKSMSEDDKFKRRGITGVVDMLLFDEFTTDGSGRPKGTTGIKHKKHKKPTKTIDKHTKV